MKDLATQVAATAEICSNALKTPPLVRTAERIEQVSQALGSTESAVRSLTVSRNCKADLSAVAQKAGVEEDLTSACLQRILLLRTALQNLQKVAELPVEASVKALICEEFRFFATPTEREYQLFAPDAYSFVALCKIALLERFPAGQFHWEISGFPRSWLFKVSPADLPKLLCFLAVEFGGLSPCFVPHMATRRKNPLMIIEGEADRSWFRMAASAQLWSGIRGLVSCSWLHSRDTFRVSPHLSFINKPFVESGALITTRGKADESEGYMAGSAQRRELYRAGKFSPTMGLVLWSRQQMRDWAHSHPELSAH